MKRAVNALRVARGNHGCTRFPGPSPAKLVRADASGRRGATECLLYAALLALALSRRLQKLVTDPESNPLSPNPPERWSHIF
jgi:hypothetical protein